MGVLTLSNGQVFSGKWHGKPVPVQGEVVFFTGMAGYEEVVTDPSYRGQIIVFSYPLIGQYGIQQLFAQSSRIQAAGIVVASLYEGPLEKGAAAFAEYAASQGVPVLSGADTRSIIQNIREEGTMQCSLSPFHSAIDWQLPKENYFDAPSDPQPLETAGTGEFHIGLVDFHFKSSILDELLQRNCRVTIVPFDTETAALDALGLDGLLFSNGPGNPEALAPLFPVYRQWAERYPSLGICLGHQVLASAFGAATEKLAYGHRGANHPVRNVRTGRVSMSSQNHSFVVDRASVGQTDFSVLYENVNDGSIEGLVHKHLPVMTVQFHPEAAPGPAEHRALFEQFLASIKKEKKVHMHA